MIDQLLANRAQPRQIPAPSATRALSTEEAYDIQDRLREALLSRGERLAGWKAGFTSRAAQEAFGVTEPVCAFLLASGVFSTGAELPWARFARLGVEAEIAFVMRHDLAGPGVTPARGAAA